MSWVLAVLCGSHYDNHHSFVEVHCPMHSTTCGSINMKFVSKVKFSYLRYTRTIYTNRAVRVVHESTFQHGVSQNRSVVIFSHHTATYRHKKSKYGTYQVHQYSLIRNLEHSLLFIINLQGKRGDVSTRISPILLTDKAPMVLYCWPHNCNYGELPHRQAINYWQV
jgi:hypothetical protein